MENDKPMEALVTQAVNGLQGNTQQRWPHLQPRANALRKSHSDLNAFCLVFNPDLQKAVARNEERAITGTAPTMKVIDIAYGEGSAAVWLLPQIHDLSSYCGVRDLEAKAAAQMAGIIASEYSYLKATEVMLFFHRFKAGMYGQFYGRVDPLIIMEALRNGFMPQRASVIEKLAREEKRLEREQWRKQAATPEEIEKIKVKLQHYEQ